MLAFNSEVVKDGVAAVTDQKFLFSVLGKPALILAALLADDFFTAVADLKTIRLLLTKGALSRISHEEAKVLVGHELIWETLVQFVSEDDLRLAHLCRLCSSCSGCLGRCSWLLLADQTFNLLKAIDNAPVLRIACRLIGPLSLGVDHRSHVGRYLL